eukprot:755177-Hanusia_phi.AAC.2
MLEGDYRGDYGHDGEGEMMLEVLVLVTKTTTMIAMLMDIVDDRSAMIDREDCVFCRHSFLHLAGILFSLSAISTALEETSSIMLHKTIGTQRRRRTCKTHASILVNVPLWFGDSILIVVMMRKKFRLNRESKLAAAAKKKERFVSSGMLTMLSRKTDSVADSMMKPKKKRSRRRQVLTLPPTRQVHLTAHMCIVSTCSTSARISDRTFATRRA